MTRIVTVSPTARVGTYSTTVTIPRTHTMTTTARVYATDSDISLNLDLQAVSAAFGQASTVEEFENLLNSSSYMISNLDLNEDGYVDYLRVLETVEGNTHVFLIQAALGDDLYQDVATLVAEVSGVSNAYVQIIGDPYIYGPRYIVQPVFVAVPPIFAHLYRHAYRPWHSPWYWNHFPPHYRRPAPIFVGHYHAYISTYMRNHRYCHEVAYPSVYHYPDYGRLIRSNQRNDFGRAHPERDFAVRTANVPSSSIAKPAKTQGEVFNARNIREMHDATKVSRTTDLKATNRSSANVETGAKSVQSSGGTSVVRSPRTGSAVSDNQGTVRKTPGIGTSGSSQSNTVNRTTINSTNRNTVSGTSRNGGNTTSNQSATVNRSQRTTGNTISRQSATTTNSKNAGTAVRRTPSTTGSQPSTRSTVRQTPQTGGASRSNAVGRTTVRSSNQTTTKSRVNNSGTASTSISTVSPSGGRVTVKRGTN